MKTSIRILQRGEFIIKLVGCCHMATEPYFRKIYSEANKDSDVVLFEGVSGEEGDSKDVVDVRSLMKFIAEVLDLRMQHDFEHLINDKWINSDMEVKAFELACSKPIINKNKFNDFKKIIEGGNISKFNRFLIKVIFAMGSFFESITYMLQRKQRHIMIYGRNFIVLNDIFKNIANGKKRISIFYGERHLDHFEKVLKTCGFNVISRKKISTKATSNV